LSLAILNAFLLARDGEPVNVEALKTAVHSLVAAGFEPSNPDKESLELYREEVENLLIQDLKSMTSAERRHERGERPHDGDGRRRTSARALETDRIYLTTHQPHTPTTHST
jgi:hypothetical protein